MPSPTGDGWRGRRDPTWRIRLSVPPDPGPLNNLYFVGIERQHEEVPPLPVLATLKRRFLVGALTFVVAHPAHTISGTVRLHRTEVQLQERSEYGKERNHGCARKSPGCETRGLPNGCLDVSSGGNAIAEPGHVAHEPGRTAPVRGNQPAPGSAGPRPRPRPDRGAPAGTPRRAVSGPRMRRQLAVHHSRS